MGNASYSFFSERNEKNNHFDYGKFQICIENEKIKKPKHQIKAKS